MMKKLLTLFTIAAISTQLSFSQGSIKFAPGFGFGFFYPKDVNDYIESLYSNAYEIYGTTDIFMNFYGSLGIIKEFDNDVSLKVSGELAFAPKVISITNAEGSGLYSVNRFSPITCINKYFPVADNSAVYLGAGASLNFLRFKKWDGIALGGHAEIGYRLKFDDYDIEVYMAGDYIKANAGPNMLLSYTGVRFGANIALGFFSPNEVQY